MIEQEEDIIYDGASIFVGKEAIDFDAKAVDAEGNIENAFNLKKFIGSSKCNYVVLFFYPLDFTFVCPTELIAINNRVAEFRKRGAEVLGISIDSAFSHLAWRNTDIKAGGIGSLGYTLISDITKDISRQYGVLIEEDGIALRGTFIIDKNFVIQHMSCNNLPIGRNVDEVIRLIDACKNFEEHGEVCPAGWSEGKESMQPTAEGVSDYLTSESENL